MNENEKMMYWIGYRDALAVVLAETKEVVKLPKVAEAYRQMTKEEHFSHAWHTT